VFIGAIVAKQRARRSLFQGECVMGKTVLYQAQNVSKRFSVGSRFSAQGRRTVHAVDNVSVEILEGETLGLVGESGCGKSTFGRCLTRLYEISEGKLIFDGTDISHLSLRQLRPLRAKFQIVFQDPSASLNPRRRVRDLIAEPLRIHSKMSEVQVSERVSELLELVGLLPDHAMRFQHEFSGGQRQRIGIARAIALNPKLIVLDEPVSALDVSVQAQIVNLLADLQEKLDLTYVFIAHDLSVVRQVSSRIAVMYLGSIVEIGEAETLFARPAHPYTQALISAVPVADGGAGRPGNRIVLTGDLPSPIDPPAGCRFHTRCPKVQDRCRTERPALKVHNSGSMTACHFPI
jgi:peptide/nickel transport system ATP-binding protein